MRNGPSPSLNCSLTAASSSKVLLLKLPIEFQTSWFIASHDASSTFVIAYMTKGTYVRSVSHVTTKRKESDHIPWIWGSAPRARRARWSPAMMQPTFLEKVCQCSFFSGYERQTGIPKMNLEQL